MVDVGLEEEAADILMLEEAAAATAWLEQYSEQGQQWWNPLSLSLMSNLELNSPYQVRGQPLQRKELGLNPRKPLNLLSPLLL